ncbi:MAG: adenylyltransferase/cytidyltransferase family protein [Candidatus Pacebacteria bacterium]|nr:adenylyltransferase/cytidyltransferase family protein [Candidatus Paceibacterota bacterium]
MVTNSFNHLKEIIEKERASGKKIVLTQGSFDLVHIGHARYLQKAKEQGDFLVVGVDSDKKIRSRKGPDRPVVPQDERMEMLTHIKHVDLVIMKDLGAPKWELIKNVKPDVLIAVEETYTDEQIEDLNKFCGQVTVLERQATTSTSAKIRLLQIGLADKLSQALMPKIIETIEIVFSEVKEEKK